MAWTCDVSIEEKVRQDCYNRGYEQGRKNPAEEIVAYIESLQNKVKEYEDKIEQGTLIELPCKVGDTVYVIYQYSDFLGTKDEPFIEEDIAQSFIYDENKMKIVPSRYGERSEYWYKTLDILLTREEAEKRLKEIQNG